MLKYTLVLAAAAVTIANGEQLTVDDAKEIKDTCKQVLDDLKAIKDAAQQAEACVDERDWCPKHRSRCDESVVARTCWKTCGRCTASIGKEALELGKDMKAVYESGKECYGVLKEKCGSLGDYKSILGVNVEFLRDSGVDLGELQNRAGCGVHEDVETVSTGEEDSSFPLPIPVLAVGGVLLLGTISTSVYFCYKRKYNAKVSKTAAGIGSDRV